MDIVVAARIRRLQLERPWDTLMQDCAFPERVIFSIGLPQRFWYAECADVASALAARAQTPPAKAG